MQDKTKKLIMWVSLAIAILGSVFAIIFAAQNPKGDMNEGNNFLFGFNFAYYTLFFFIVASIGAILFFLVKSLVKGGSRGLLIGLGLLVVVGVIAWLLSSGTDVSEVRLDRNGLTQGASKLIGAACYTVYTLLAASVLAIIYVECAKLFKKK